MQKSQLQSMCTRNQFVPDVTVQDTAQIPLSKLRSSISFLISARKHRPLCLCFWNDEHNIILTKNVILKLSFILLPENQFQYDWFSGTSIGLFAKNIHSISEWVFVCGLHATLQFTCLFVCLQQQFYGEVALFGTDEWDLFYLFSRVSHLGRRIKPPFL